MQCPQCDKETSTDRVFCNWCETFIPAPSSGAKAGLFRRWLASFIDPALVAIAIFVPAATLVGIGGETAGLTLALLAGGATVILFAVMFGRGMTPGKWLLGTRVIDKLRGHPPGFFRMLVREVFGKFASGLVLGLGFFWAIWDRDHQGWHDKIAGTVVVKRRHMAPATAQARATDTSPA